MMTACAARFDPAVEAAFLRTYGVDTLADPGPTPRRMWALLHHLPPGVLHHMDTAAAWSVETHMLANLLDALHDLTWVTVASHSRRPPKRPKPVTRPGGRRKQRVSALGLADALTGQEGVVLR